MNQFPFLFILLLLLCGTVAQAQTGISNKEKAYQKFKREIEQRKKHREEMLLKAGEAQSRTSAPGNLNHTLHNGADTLSRTNPAPSGNGITAPEPKAVPKKTVKPATRAEQQ